MAVYKNSAPFGNIVTDGLVLNLDATNTNSYPGSGTTWNDTSKYNNPSTLFNGPTFLRERGRGSIVFDGVDDFATGSFANPSVLNTNAITLETWVYHTTLSTTVQRYISTFPSGLEQAVIRFDGPQGEHTLRFYIVTSTGYKFITIPNQIYVNNWYHVVGTWDGTSQALYKNTALLQASNQTGTLVTSPLVYYLSLSVESMNGYMSIARIYNKALTPTEIQQNYNAIKSRFGL
jgi:hypothetical protein